tara:strand:- start:166 stop:1419 length:1254 start_codon:yes stop_codon:yes gene_type:complete
MHIKNTVIDISKKAKNASDIISILSNKTKNSALENLISTIKNNYSQILESNKIDIDNAYKNSLPPQLINRLTFTEKSIDELIKSIKAIISQPDPIGKIINEWTQPNGLIFKKITVPLGVIGVIYESRPNVTVDAACIAIKSGNCLILRGGSDSFHTSNTLVNIIAKSFEEVGLPKYAIQMIPFVDRNAVDYLIQMNDHIDVIIPRGGKGLIKKINSQSLIPVIKHLDGICHVYIDKDADLEKAKKVLFNSKMRRPEICGATETLLIDEDIKKMSLNLLKPLIESNCEIRGDEYICSLSNKFLNASNKDWETEYLDKIISVKIVNGVKGAIKHIKKYSSGHTESIITENKKTFFDFYQNIDSAIILNNASTQFADGGEFGFGAEIGISTDKLHVRGPVSAEHLTSFKYIVLGDGHERE